jgi:hypothetical protein
MPGEAILDDGLLEGCVKRVHIEDGLARMPGIAGAHEDVRAAEPKIALRVETLQRREGGAVQRNGVRLVVFRTRHADHAVQPVDPVPLRSKEIRAPQTGVAREDHLVGQVR